MQKSIEPIGYCHALVGLLLGPIGTPKTAPALPKLALSSRGRGQPTPFSPFLTALNKPPQKEGGGGFPLSQNTLNKQPQKEGVTPYMYPPIRPVTSWWLAPGI
jgi:hypothetical protein